MAKVEARAKAFEAKNIWTRKFLQKYQTKQEQEC